MTAMPAEANFSELIQKPKDTVARMQVNARRGLLLRRRDEEDLYLTTAARADQGVQVVDSITRMFAALLKESPAAVDLLTRVIPEVFPWGLPAAESCSGVPPGVRGNGSGQYLAR
ncbi:hypothetical protein ACFV10_10840 [Streptomyces cyaneofuscatus]|uniref:hypothetical protein n=1 Tax=Streptomyces cyaneofuscatus TaxID=66883 RepID=UPI00368F8835